MARSGTTLAQHILGLQPDTHVEVEPHMVWKAGNFRYLSDERYDIREDACRWIRESLTKGLNGRLLIEKSPVNSLRPELVQAVFPEARIAYLERDAIACIDSNLRRSETRDSLNPRIIFRKYLLHSGSRKLCGAVSKRSLRRQLRLRDYHAFVWYAFRMAYLRQVADCLPFGPKLAGFRDIVRSEGLVRYHVRVFLVSQQKKAHFARLYGKRMATFRLEELQTERDEVERLCRFAGYDVTKRGIQDVMGTFSRERIARAGDVKHADVIAQALRELSQRAGCGV